jgi:hypothetical protein
VVCGKGEGEADRCWLGLEDGAIVDDGVGEAVGSASAGITVGVGDDDCGVVVGATVGVGVGVVSIIVSE